MTERWQRHPPCVARNPSEQVTTSCSVLADVPYGHHGLGQMYKAPRHIPVWPMFLFPFHGILHVLLKDDQGPCQLGDPRDLEYL